MSQPLPQVEEGQQNKEGDEQVVDQNLESNSQQFQQNEKRSRFNQGPQPLMSLPGPPPLVPELQQKEGGVEKVVDQNVLPINQRFQQNEKHSRFNQGPQPLMSQPPPSIEHTQQNEQSDQQTEEVFDEHQ